MIYKTGTNNQLNDINIDLEKFRLTTASLTDWALKAKQPESFVEKIKPVNSLEPIDYLTEQLLQCAQGGNQPMLEDMCRRYSLKTLRNALDSLPKTTNRDTIINNLEATISKILIEKQAQEEAEKANNTQKNYVNDVIASIVATKKPEKEEDKLLTWVEKITRQAVREALELTKRMISR